MPPKTNSLRAWLLAARPKTLTAASVPVLIGTAMAWRDALGYVPGAFCWAAAVLALLFAFAMQIDANLINDYFDYARGRDDAATRLGPARACASGWVTLPAMRRAIAITTCLACLIGLPLVMYGGLEMIAVGVLCVLFCFLYTTCLAGRGMGDVLVLVFFGIVPVCVCYYLHLHTITAGVFFLSLLCGIAVNSLLTVNNYRDLAQDAAAGKRTLAVAIGPKWTRTDYLLGGIVASLAPAFYVSPANLWPALLLLPYLALHIANWRRLCRLEGKALNSVLGATAAGIFLYGIVVAAGIVLA